MAASQDLRPSKGSSVRCSVLPAGFGRFQQEQYSAPASQTVGWLEFSKILQMCLLMSSSKSCNESIQGQYRQGAGGVERAQPVFRKMGTAEGRYAGGMKKSDGNLLLCKPAKTSSIRKAVEAKTALVLVCGIWSGFGLI